MSPAPCCPQEVHEQRKRESQFPRLAYVGIQKLGDIELELRNCECGSTLAREVRR